MPRFLVKQYRDAFIVYETEIEAASKEEAYAKAKNDECQWEDSDVLEYDEREIPLDEIEEMSED